MRDSGVDRPFARRHPVVTVLAVVTAAWWLWQGWYEALALVVVAGLIVVARKRRRTALLRDAGLRARADYEHRLNLVGDPRGLYGRYAPVGPNWVSRSAEPSLAALLRRPRVDAARGAPLSVRPWADR